MIVWVFAVIALGAGVVASVADNMRTATLSLWLASLASGGIYLTLGAETLAIVQWIVSTLVAISLIFFAFMFGEFDRAETVEKPIWKNFPTVARTHVLMFALAAVVGIAFVAVIVLGAAGLSDGSNAIPEQGNDLLALGRHLVGHHLLSLEVLAGSLLLVLVGGGVVARPEATGEEDSP